MHANTVKWPHFVPCGGYRLNLSAVTHTHDDGEAVTVFLANNARVYLKGADAAEARRVFAPRDDAFALVRPVPAEASTGSPTD